MVLMRAAVMPAATASAIFLEVRVGEKHITVSLSIVSIVLMESLSILILCNVLLVNRLLLQPMDFEGLRPAEIH